MQPRGSTILAAFSLSALILALGYVAFGGWTTLIFSSGFLGGFLLWIVAPNGGSYNAIRMPYWTSLVLFLAHRVEEKTMGFFDVLASITRVATPDILSWSVVLLVLASVGAWLLVLPLMKRGHPFGDYLAWTFFCAMGVTELAHFVLPIFRDVPYGYFPGMASVVLLAPIAWLGIYRLVSNQSVRPR